MSASPQPAPAAPAPTTAEHPGLSTESWPHVETLPCTLTVEIPMPAFTVADLVSLVRGRIVPSHWTVGQDVPLRANGELIAWSEFEIVQNHLAIRLTELA